MTTKKQHPQSNKKPCLPLIPILLLPLLCGSSSCFIDTPKFAAAFSSSSSSSSSKLQKNTVQSVRFRPPFSRIMQSTPLLPKQQHHHQQQQKQQEVSFRHHDHQCHSFASKSFALYSSSQNNNNDNDNTTTTNEEEDDDDTNNNANSATKALGNSLILAAAKHAGVPEKMISIAWKSDLIVVTVDVHANENDENIEYIVANDAVLEEGEFFEEGEELFEYDDDDDDDDDDDFEEGEFDDEEFEDDDFDDDDEFDEDKFEDEESTTTTNTKTIDLTLLARTINDHLSANGETSPAYRIAQLYAIEVTTPEFDGVLRGELMFEAYKGFDVIVEHYEDPSKKKKKNKKSGVGGGGGSSKSGKSAGGKDLVENNGGGDNDTNGGDGGEEEEEEEIVVEKKLITSEGKLVGRDDEKEVTMVNIKGRIVKIKNELIESVALPKAKREKGVK